LKLIKVALAYLRQAKARLEDAKDAVKEENYPYAVRLSQECVELCLKAVLKAVGIEYPKVHDVSDVLADVKTRFPPWFQEEIDYMCESSKILVKKREPSLYGEEGVLLSPYEVISKADAHDAVERANRIFQLCNKLIKQLEK
jgi:HEPN domain-containing protein